MSSTALNLVGITAPATKIGPPGAHAHRRTHAHTCTHRALHCPRYQHCSPKTLQMGTPESCIEEGPGNSWKFGVSTRGRGEGTGNKGEWDEGKRGVGQGKDREEGVGQARGSGTGKREWDREVGQGQERGRAQESEQWSRHCQKVAAPKWAKWSQI